MSEKDLIFSNSSQEEPTNLDMKKMKNQRKEQKASEEALKEKRLKDQSESKENINNKFNKKKILKSESTPGLLPTPGQNR